MIFYHILTEIFLRTISVGLYWIQLWLTSYLSGLGVLANFSSRSVGDHVTSSYIRSYIRFFAFSESHPTVTRYTFYTMPFLYCNLHLTNIRLCNAFLLFKLA